LNQPIGLLPTFLSLAQSAKISTVSAFSNDSTLGNKYAIDISKDDENRTKGDKDSPCPAKRRIYEKSHYHKHHISLYRRYHTAANNHRNISIAGK
jgi:hypothetical protein